MDNQLLRCVLTHETQRSVQKCANSYRFIDRSHIPKKAVNSFVEAFGESTNVLMSISKENPLSRMETMVLGLCTAGLVDADIAKMLGISPNTVKTYMKRIKEKFSVTRKTDAVTKALRLGVLKV